MYMKGSVSQKFSELIFHKESVSEYNYCSVNFGHLAWVFVYIYIVFLTQFFLLHL